MSPAEKRLVIKAIQDLGRRVTAGDVAAKTGLGILLSTRLLNAIAAECGACLAVTESGAIIYSFPLMFQAAYVRRGIVAVAWKATKALLDLAYYLVRVSFGITLIVSLFIIAALIFAVLSAMQQKNSSDGTTLGAICDPQLLAGLSRFFCLRPEASPSKTARGIVDDYNAYLRGQYISSNCAPSEPRGFLLNCFSYLFGDGNPNVNFEETKWQVIAQFISQQKGAVIAEQLACYTGADPKREYAALPVLVRFDGQPMVSERGNIIYRFPSLTATAGALAATPPAYLEEKHWSFWQQSSKDFVTIATIALVNFSGCIWLLRHSALSELHRYTALIDWLTIYGAFFLFFPLLRYLAQVPLNIAIDWRNARRRASFKYLSECGDKLADALAYSASSNIAAQPVVYSTDRDLLEQQFE